MEEQYQFSYRLDKKTYQYFMKRRILGKRRYFISLLSDLLILLNFGGAVSSLTGGAYGSFFIFAALMTAILLWNIFYRQGGYHRYSENYLDPSQQVSISVGKKIEIVSGDRRFSYEYEQADELYEGREAFYLRFGEHFVFLPKNALSGAYVMDFRLFLMSRRYKAGNKPEKKKNLFYAVAFLFLSLICAGAVPYGLLYSGDVGKTSEQILAEHYGSGYRMVYRYATAEGQVIFLYGSENRYVVNCTLIRDGSSWKFSQNGGYRLSDVADYNEQQNKLFYSKPVTYPGGSLEYGWIYADSVLKAQIPEKTENHTVFSADGKKYILYIKGKTESI